MHFTFSNKSSRWVHCGPLSAGADQVKCMQSSGFMPAALWVVPHCSVCDKYTKKVAWDAGLCHLALERIVLHPVIVRRPHKLFLPRACSCKSSSDYHSGVESLASRWVCIKHRRDEAIKKRPEEQVSVSLTTAGRFHDNQNNQNVRNSPCLVVTLWGFIWEQLVTVLMAPRWCQGPVLKHFLITEGFLFLFPSSSLSQVSSLPVPLLNGSNSNTQSNKYHLDWQLWSPLFLFRRRLICKTHICASQQI